MKFLDTIIAALDWPADMIIRHFERRQFELAMAVIMSGVGLLLFFSPGSLAVSSMKYLLDVISVATCSALFFTAGIARIVALALNGNWVPGGAYVRACGAAIGAVMWSQWGAALYQLHLTGKPISPGVIVYGGLAFFEVISFSRSLRGAVSGGQANRQDLGKHRHMARHPVASPDFLYRNSDLAVTARHKSGSLKVGS
jgi:hypothetical protein